MTTLLALHAHPDDESSKGAATVARYANSGVRCVLITATGGEAGEVLNKSMDRADVRENLGEVRRQELSEAAEIIGYGEVILLGYRDSGMPGTADNQHREAFVNAPFDEAVGRVVAVVRKHRPEVLLGYDSHERYPHPDHLRVHQLGLDVFDASADGARYPEAGVPWQISKLYAPVFTMRRMRILHRALRDRGMDSPFEPWIHGLDESEAADPEVTRVHVGGYIERAREALRAHRTQIDPDGFWFLVPGDLVREVYPYEDFQLLKSRVEVEPGEEDLFAGIEA